MTISTSIEHIFSDLTDPRRDRNRRHLLPDILTITICATICGAEYWTEIEEFGKERREWFSSFLELPHGIPSHDTLNDFFRRLNPTEFEKYFIEWMKQVAHITNGEVIAIDGKTLRGSYDKCDDKAAIHMVSAYATSNRLILGQIKTAEKSNEITAIPELLRILDVEGSVITIDAMGCQKAIAQGIREQKADYVLALKGNHPELYDNVVTYFDEYASLDIKYDEETEIYGNHGRIESRKCVITEEIDWLYGRSEWKGLKSIAMILSRREVNDEISEERRYYLLSLEGNAKRASRCIRDHWGVENCVHWLLDVAFSEDSNRTRKDNGAENFSIIRRVALNLLRQETSCKLGVKSRRKKAGWSQDYLKLVLQGVLN